LAAVGVLVFLEKINLGRGIICKKLKTVEESIDG